MRNIEKTCNDARHVLEEKTMLCISAGEMMNFVERMKGEHPLNVLYDMFLFGFMIGHRAGKRAAKV